MTNKKTPQAKSPAATVSADIEDKGKDFSKKLPIFGHVMWLYTQSSPHKYYFIQDMESRVLSPIMLEQCKLYIKTKTTGLPIAFVSWAFLSEEAEERYTHSYRLAPSDWKSGDNLWIIDILTPFGGGDKIYQELYHSIFKDRDIHLLFPSEKGGLVKKTVQELIDSAKAAEPETTKH